MLMYEGFWRSLMTIIDAISNADSEYVIYFLLAAYIEAAQFAASLPDYVRNLPITGSKDVETRFRQLATACYEPIEQVDDKAVAVIHEALHIFDTALCRLTLLERRKEPSLSFDV